VNDFHLGLLPNELAGVHEGAVPPASQAICCAELFAADIAEIDAVILRMRKTLLIGNIPLPNREPRVKIYRSGIWL
jgi:hypothetical protein